MNLKKLLVLLIITIFSVKVWEIKLKIHLAMAINFISSKEDSDETHTMHAKSGNTLCFFL